MKCPKCGGLKASIHKISGYSTGIEKECINCGYIWIEKNDKILSINPGK